jgi:hypothetical protein
MASATSKLAFDKFACKMKRGKTNHESVEKRITMLKSTDSDGENMKGFVSS